jgi:DNA-binding Lrp family transcriptional regulator
VTDQLGHLVARPDQADGEQGQVVGMGLGEFPEVVVVHASRLGRGALLDVDLAAIGRTVQALIAVRIRPPSRRNIEAFRDWAARLPDTVGVFVVSGSEDFLLHVAVPDNQQLYAFVIDKLTERPEVADVRTSVIYEYLRNHAVAPAAGP